MNLKSLSYLVALADHQHFGRAADACYVSQPTLSMQLKKLEEYLGVQLIERTNKSLLFTAIGNEIVERARRVLAEAEQIKECARSQNNPEQGRLTLGVIPTLAPYVLPRILPEVAQHFPKLTVYLRELKTADLLDELKQGRVDAALLALPIDDDDSFVKMHLFDEPFMLAVAQSHPYSQLEVVDQNQLEQQSVLLLEDGHCLRDHALAVCRLMRVNESTDFRATSLETLRQMVASGVGMTLLPQVACEQAYDNLSYIPFSDPKPYRSVGMLSRSTSAKQELIKQISTIISAVY